jgi:photosystem II stability/assembly factor-like uncharacterized protein
MKRFVWAIPSAIAVIAAVSVFILTDQNPDEKSAFRAEYEQSALQAAKDAGLDKALKEPDMPGMAAYQDFFTTMDPALGRVPMERMAAAFDQVRDDAASHRLKSGRDLEWNIVPSNMGGRTRCIMYDPNDVSGNKVWAGAVTGGLWYNNSITSGLSAWVPVDDFWGTLSISSITFDPNNTQTFYVGTGEPFTAIITYRESTNTGLGIYKSTDGGQTWNILPSTQYFKYISDIEVRNENGSSVIYAGVVSGVYQGEEHQSMPTDGLYRSADGGQSWVQVLPLIPGSNKPYPVADIEITSANRIMVGTKRNLNDEGGSTILWSDQGIIGTWAVFDDYVDIIQNDPDWYVIGRVMIGSAPSDPNIAYALFEAGYVNSENGFVYSRGRHIARTNDGGQSWSYRPTPSGNNYGWASIGWHALTVGVDPNNPEALYIGGLDVYKSINGGQNWSHVSDWSLMYYGGGDEYVHADIHDIDYKAGSSSEMLVTSDGGVFYTANATSASPIFQEKNLGYGSLQFYVTAIDPTSGEEQYVGGLQDNGTLLYTGPALTINHMIDGGDGAYCFIDENEPQYMITSVYYNAYSLWVNGNYSQSMSNWSSGTFISPADYDYKLNILYSNACGFDGSNPDKLVRIKNIGGNIQGGYLSMGTGSTTWFSHVKYSPLSPGNTSTLFLGTLSGKLFKVTNAQATPSSTNITGDDFPVANLSSVAIGNSEDTLLVTFSNFGVTSAWKTFDGGATWASAEGNLPDVPVRWSLLHPAGASYAMLATDMGIWTTENLLEDEVTWTQNIEGLANVRIDHLDFRTSDNTVLAATHGRGMATATWDIYTGIENPGRTLAATVYPNPNNGKFTLSAPVTAGAAARVEIFGMNGNKVFEKDYNGRAGGFKQVVDLDQVQDGQYIVKITSGNDVSSGKLIIRK